VSEPEKPESSPSSEAVSARAVYDDIVRHPTCCGPPFAEGVCISPSVPLPIIPCQNFVDAVDGLGHSCLLSRCQSPQCRSRHERQVSSGGIDRGTPTRPLALSDDLVSPIVECVCCCHRRASQEAPVRWRNTASAMRFTSHQKKKPPRVGLTQ